MSRLKCKKCDNIISTIRIPKLCPLCGAENSLQDTDMRSAFVDVDDLLK